MGLGKGQSPLPAFCPVTRHTPSNLTPLLPCVFPPPPGDLSLHAALSLSDMLPNPAPPAPFSCSPR
jgi:hypothetical protein